MSLCSQDINPERNGNLGNRQDLIEVFKMYKAVTKLDIGELFAKYSNVKSIRGHTLKPEKPQDV